jgi:hypothetical protein
MHATAAALRRMHAGTRGSRDNAATPGLMALWGMFTTNESPDSRMRLQEPCVTRQIDPGSLPLYPASFLDVQEP